MNRADYIAIAALFYDAPKLQTAAIATHLTAELIQRDITAFLDSRKLSDRSRLIYQQRQKTVDVSAIVARHEEKDIRILTPVDPGYPPRLLECVDPPAALFYRGNVKLLTQNPCLAIVGTRDVTAYGRQVTQTLTAGLQSFFTIVSGLAAGVDAIAHESTVQAGGQTVAVMGTAFDQIYPRSNQGLFDQIVKNGLVMTEYPLGTQSQKYFFPMRNRLVSGISEGVLVCEAGEKSGSLITARLTMEQGREVFCVPGSIFVKQNEGNHTLIQDGAKLVTSLEDILVSFPYLLAQFSTGQTISADAEASVSLDSLSDEERLLIEHLSQSDTELDVLASQSQFSIQKTLQLLMQLELSGHVEKTGTCYRRCA